MESAPIVAVVTDSAAGIPTDLLARYNIKVVPYWVHLGSESFISGETIEPPEFFRRLRANPEIEVHTGVPAAAKFAEIYKSLASWAKSIVSVHVASKQSGTCSAAALGANDSPIPVVVLDTETTAMGEGFVALEAARAASEGGTLDHVIARAKAAIPYAGVVALLESVTYALKGGRLSSAAGKVGSFLKIQPLVRVHDNKVSLIGQARRRSKGIEALIERITDEAKEDPVHLTVHYAEDEQEGHSLLDTLKARLNCIEAYLTRVPVELGVHAGPGSIGVAYHIERENVGLAQQLEQQLEHLSRLGNQAKEAIRSRLPGG
ncbi:MAG: DegV family protein [Anaerolineae bacterium]|jgi:DegV family protein with EDD domain|nr:DegV family protein [Anaerolineae bacterium]